LPKAHSLRQLSGDAAESISIDSSGNIYVAGRTKSSDFPTTPGAYDTAYNGGDEDAFVSKLDADLSADVGVWANFTADQTEGSCPLTVQFTDQSTGEITSWFWEFGDGETSTEQNPTHTYNSTGYFTVSLTVTGPGGSDTETREDYIHVTQVATPVADIKANNSDGPITLYQNDTLTITVSLNNNGITEDADWWLAADTPFGLFFFTFDGWTDAWVPGYQSPLFYLDSFEVLNMPVSGLPAGIYTLYFGVDTVMDGNVTWDSVYYDTVVVNIIGYSYLLEKYAPVLKFSSGEGYYPTRVENMIDNSCIQIKENSTCLDLFCDGKGTD